MYILLTGNIVSEIIPDEHPSFPGVPVKDRYAPDFVAKLLPVDDDTEVAQNWEYNPETGSFSAPPEPEPVEPSPEPDPTPEPDPAEPTDTEVLNALLGVPV